MIDDGIENDLDTLAQRAVRPLPNDPTVIGRYQIVGRLGVGGMGKVYLGRAPNGRLVAVKVIHPRLAREERYLRRFQREASLAQRVATFCTAPVLEYGQHDGVPYLVTEYVDGLPLSQVVEDRGPLAHSSSYGVAVGVAAALTAIHAAGLVHRDLKPANVLLSLSGPRVIDFGVVRALDVPSDLTGTGVAVGSPGWMAPEQTRAERATPAADVFSWGCLVAYASTGRHPFGDGDSLSRMMQVLDADPDLSGVPDRLYPHVAHALAKDPRVRPTARDLLATLSAGVGDMTQVVRIRELTVPLRPASGAPAHVVERRRYRRRRRGGWVASVGTLLVVALLGVGIGYFLLLGPDGAAPPGPVPATGQVPADDQQPAHPADNPSPSSHGSASTPDPQAPSPTSEGSASAPQPPRGTDPSPTGAPPEQSPSASKSPSESTDQPAPGSPQPPG